MRDRRTVRVFAVRFTEPNEDYSHQHQNVRTENGIKFGDLPEFVEYPT